MLTDDQLNELQERFPLDPLVSQAVQDIRELRLRAKHAEATLADVRRDFRHLATRFRRIAGEKVTGWPYLHALKYAAKQILQLVAGPKGPIHSRLADEGE